MSLKTRKVLKKAAQAVLFPLASVTAIVAVYALAAAAVGESIILPRVGEILWAIGGFLTSANFYAALGFTLLRSLLAFAASLFVGFALGVCAYKSKTVERLVSPIMVLLRAIPTMAVIFLLVLWFRSALAPAIVAFTIVMPLFYRQTFAALSSLDKGLFEMSRVYEVPRSRVLFRFVLPEIAPPLIADAAGDLSFTVKLVIAGEALAQTALSLGGSLNLANIYLETARLMAITVLAVAVCFLLEGAVRLLLLRSRRWRE